ncbi:MAG: DASH family cryptochrome [Cyclobacteriaceae bacterium]|nr:DASH family cryptochrome [Cyclobacteriaceae bacterium]
MPTTILVWFKNDLRLHDNETWYRACQQADWVIPLYVFDPRQFAHHKLGFPRSGSFRTQFLIESVTALQEKLMQAGSNLIVRFGLPEFIIPEICTENKVSHVFIGSEVASEEVSILNSLTRALGSKKVGVQTFDTSTLIHPNHLPFALANLPNQFTLFRKQVERNWIVQPLFEEPEIKSLPQLEPGTIPNLKELVLPAITPDLRSVITYKGGEAEAHQRLKEYIWDKDLLKVYKETRNELIGPDYSSKFSPALALGCISARSIYYEVKKYEFDRVSNESTYWLIFELLWRDYFRFASQKYGSRIFQRFGISNKHINWKHDLEKFNAWRLGKTGVDFVDANMKELLLTGFMSNRGRQNVASYLTKDLGIDWRWGAAWFESQLIDYDACSNWLNWAYVAGVGNDPRQDRYFNIESQVRKYDPDRLYMKLWIGKQEF